MNMMANSLSPASASALFTALKEGKSSTVNLILLAMILMMKLAKL